MHLHRAVYTLRGSRGFASGCRASRPRYGPEGPPGVRYSGGIPTALFGFPDSPAVVGLANELDINTVCVKYLILNEIWSTAKVSW